MMKNPAHPGDILRTELREGYGLSVQESARKLGISRAALSCVLNKKARLREELAYRLELAGVGTARFWLSVQNNYDLAKLINTPKSQQPKVFPIAN